ncbi:MAG: transketolase [Acidobacteriota bacterium]
MDALDLRCVNTLRLLAVDQVETARSGHPGMPLGAAPMAYALWDRFLKFDPADPRWPDRDRFVLSAGHGSALLYALLHLYGYDLPLGELRRFRQWGSRTPGHPEYGHVPGVEATTGPLGQGLAMAVGMAMAEAHLAARFNREGHRVVDHFTYVLASDGDLMEGASHEAGSLAGTLGLGKLIVLYDDNRISIEGPTELAFTEEVGARFAAYGWQVLSVEDGEDVERISAALEEARSEQERPSLIRVRTHIGQGSPKQDSASSHGEPLGPEAARATRKALGFPEEETFVVPAEVRDHARRAAERGAEAHRTWRERTSAFEKAFPDAGAELRRRWEGRLPGGWEGLLPAFDGKKGPVATRSASGKVLNALAPAVTELFGGSADLAPSNKTLLEGSPDFSRRSPQGRNVHFGVRELAMGAAVNGLALHGGILPYGATFLVFSDFLRPALRLAALMQTHAVFIFTHDSIGVGEDGPTHQPVEHLLSLRTIPGLTVLRPADANETAAAWRLALSRKGPAVLALSRQNLPVLSLEEHPQLPEGVARGGYILAEADPAPLRGVIVATGSEVHLALKARELLRGEGIGVRVVSMPWPEGFLAQPGDYREAVLPPGVPRLVVEAGVTRGWAEVAGEGSAVVGLDRFGASAPGEEVFARLGFTAEEVARRLKERMAATRESP